MIKRYKKTINSILSLARDMDSLTDEQMAKKTLEFKERISKGESLDSILPEAFALVRAASKRVLGMEHFRVQLLGGIVLHEGKIAEMRTGEGKTLVATCPAYLNALTGKGVHIITVNDYLSKTNKEQMGRIFELLGLSVGCITADTPLYDRKRIYQKDIVYGTNKEFGFDYLRDNMAKDYNLIAQRELNYVIIDEADSVLIDEARTPLIISGADEQTCDLYISANKFVQKLVKGIDEDSSFKENDTDNCDFLINERKNTIHLTDRGVRAAEKFFELENLGDIENVKIAHCINQAIRAHYLMENGKDYIVKNGEVVIVDNFTGRLMDGRRFNDGLHQAIEAKEGVEVQSETCTYATITLQNYFKLYNKVSGMTGTAFTEKKEFKETYGLDIVVIPTNKPVIRNDKSDLLFKTTEDKYAAIVEVVKDKNGKGQPVLIGTSSILQSENLSKYLSKNKIRHQVLNAKQHEREAEIIAQAGRKGAVTIATNMAGRGTDIILGGNAEFLAKAELIRNGYPRRKVAEAATLIPSEDPIMEEIRGKYKELYANYKKETDKEHQEVVALGGLCVIGTERHDAVRVDNQLRGRAGRQGDPGESQFYISLDDRLIDLFSYLNKDADVNKKKSYKQVSDAQKRVEQQYFEFRKDLLDYDDVSNVQRKQIYALRLSILKAGQLENFYLQIVDKSAEEICSRCLNGDCKNIAVLEKYLNHISGMENITLEKSKLIKAIIDNVKQEILKAYINKNILLGNRANDMMRFIAISYIDRSWMRHLDNMEALKQTTQMTGYGNIKPLDKYKLDAFNLYKNMINDLYVQIICGYLNIRYKKQGSRIDNMPKSIQNLAHEMTMKSLTNGTKADEKEIEKRVFDIVEREMLTGGKADDQ